VRRLPLNNEQLLCYGSALTSARVLSVLVGLIKTTRKSIFTLGIFRSRSIGHTRASSLATATLRRGESKSLNFGTSLFVERGELIAGRVRSGSRAVTKRGPCEGLEPEVEQTSAAAPAPANPRRVGSSISNSGDSILISQISNSQVDGDKYTVPGIPDGDKYTVPGIPSPEFPIFRTRTRVRPAQDQDQGQACINALSGVASVEWTSAERPAFAKPLSAPSTQSCRPRTHAQLGIPHTPLECLLNALSSRVCPIIGRVMVPEDRLCCSHVGRSSGKHPDQTITSRKIREIVMQAIAQKVLGVTGKALIIVALVQIGQLAISSAQAASSFCRCFTSTIIDATLAELQGSGVKALENGTGGGFVCGDDGDEVFLRFNNEDRSVSISVFGETTSGSLGPGCGWSGRPLDTTLQEARECQGQIIESWAWKVLDCPTL